MKKNYTQITINDTLYELPEHTALELGDGLIENLGVAAEDLVQIDNVTKEEEALILEKVKKSMVLMILKNLLTREKFLKTYIFLMVVQMKIFLVLLSFWALIQIIGNLQLFYCQIWEDKL